MEYQSNSASAASNGTTSSVATNPISDSELVPYRVGRRGRRADWTVRIGVHRDKVARS